MKIIGLTRSSILAVKRNIIIVGSIYAGLFFVLPIQLAAQDDKHKTEIKYEDCLAAEPQTTLHVNKCLQQAMVDWDKQLNEGYQQLRGKLSEKQKENLKSSQVLWIKFRDAEFNFVESQFEGMEGTMYPNLILTRKIEIIKHRVFELEKYLKFYETF